MASDLDYAAIAVKTAIVEKFGRKNELQSLSVTAGDKVILIDHDGRQAEGTRDDLLASLRASDSYERLWEVMPTREKPRRRP